jgi:sulfate/thiosulfate transport system permease protein
MAPSSFPQPEANQGNWITRFFSRLVNLSWPWRITWFYLLVMLVLPSLALLAKSATLSLPDIWRIVTDPVALSAFEVTFITSGVATLINGVFGLATAWVLVRYDFPFRRIVDAAIDLPFALPTAVAGLTLATVYSDNGWIGSLLAPLGIKVQPVLQEMEKEIEEAAWCLGASDWQTFWRVLLPPLIPALLTGLALGFSRAVGEYGSIVIIAANVPFQDLIAPVLVFQRLEQYDYAGATVIGMVMLLVSLAILVGINVLQSWGRRYG